MNRIAEAISRKGEQNPQFEYMFRVELPSINNIPPQAMEANWLLGSGQDKSSLISHRVYGVNVPFTSYETIKHTDKDSFWYSAGGSDIGNISMRVDEYEDGETLKYFLTWQSLIGNGDGTHNPPAIYKRDIVLFKLAASGEDIHAHRYIGYYPINIGEASHSNDSSSILQYNISLSGDTVEHIFVSSSQIKELIRTRDIEIKENVDDPMDFQQLLKNEFNRQLTGKSELFSAINKITSSLRI